MVQNYNFTKTRQKRQVHIQKNRRSAFRILTSGIMLVLLFSTTLLYASSSSSPGIAEFLNKDGTLNLDTGFRGSINLAGFRVSIDECFGITAISTPDAVMPPGTWSALSTGMNSWLSVNSNAIVINGSDLYACGYFITAGGTTVNRVAKWRLVVLPVELLGFQASVQDNQTALLSWKTATETNNHGFDIVLHHTNIKILRKKR